MNYRIADSSSSISFSNRINAQRNRLSVLEEQLTSGKRINRPSDDPTGAEAVLRLKTSQTEIAQFQRNANAASERLVAADDVLNSYGTLLDRVQTLTAQSLSDTTTQDTRNHLATELESLRGRILSLANSKSGDEYVFGGTRQNAAPFDSTTATPSAIATSPQKIQIEPGANAIAVGVTAETIFADYSAAPGTTIFSDLTNAIAALRGTGNASADRATLEATMTRLGVYKNLASDAQTRIGVNMNHAETATDNLANSQVSFESRISNIETADFAETALKYTEAQSVLDATLQIAAKGKRSLFDYLG